jgi:hypothetical protein
LAGFLPPLSPSGKSSKDEVELYLPKEIPISDELKKAGAKVFAYNKNFTPNTRFTMINLGRDDAQVAIGRRVDGHFVIEKYSLGNHPTFSLAEDIVNILKEQQRMRE